MCKQKGGLFVSSLVVFFTKKMEKLWAACGFYFSPVVFSPVVFFFCRGGIGWKEKIGDRLLCGRSWPGDF